MYDFVNSYSLSLNRALTQQSDLISLNNMQTKHQVERRPGCACHHCLVIKESLRSTIWCVTQTEGSNCFSESSAIRSKYNRAETAGGVGVRGRGAGRRPDQPRPCAHCRKGRCYRIRTIVLVRSHTVCMTFSPNFSSELGSSKRLSKLQIISRIKQFALRPRFPITQHETDRTRTSSEEANSLNTVLGTCDQDRAI